MKILVTGGCGFIGSHIVDLLHESNHTIVVVDNLSTGKLENISEREKVTFYNRDIRSTRLEEVFEKERPDIVIHQAAQINVAKSIDDPEKDAMINVLGTINLLNLSTKYNIKKFIFASSCAVYGNTDQIPTTEDNPHQPFSIYGVSKHSSEQYIKVFNHLFGLPYTILRYANVYGPRQTANGEGGVISIFIEKLLSGKSPIIYGDGTQTRDFVFVKDVAKANVLAIEKADNQIINIGTKHTVDINSLYKTLSAYIPSHKTTPEYLPMKEGDIPHSCLDNQKAWEQLGWKPETSFNDGLKQTISVGQRDRNNVPEK